MQTEIMEDPEPSLDPNDYMTVKECAKACRFKGPEAIRRAIKRGDLKAYNMKYHHLLVPRTEFIRWFKSRIVKPEPEEPAPPSPPPSPPRSGPKGGGK